MRANALVGLVDRDPLGVFDHDHEEQLSEKLQKALDSRLIIEQAKRITAYQRAVTVDQACLRMRRHAITTPACGSSRGDRQRGASGLSSAAVAVAVEDL